MVNMESDSAHLIPPNKDMGVYGGMRLCGSRAQPHRLRLPVDFLRSLAKDRGSNAAGVPFSGTGTDGTLVLKAIKTELG